LREKDIRNAIPGESYQDKVELTKAGIANYFKNVNEFYSENLEDFIHKFTNRKNEAGLLVYTFSDKTSKNYRIILVKFIYTSKNGK
jgi:hypothetical protein